MGSNARAILSYFALRYYLAAIFFSFIFISVVDTVTTFEEWVLHNAMQLLHNAVQLYVTTFGDPAPLALQPLQTESSVDRTGLHVETDTGPITFDLPLIAQMLFFVFFPTIAFTARINMKMRLRLLGFGIICFLLFMAVQLIIIASSLYIEPLQSPFAFRVTSIIVTILTGGLAIELALFTTVTIPTPTKLKPFIKRSYLREYVNLLIILVSSSIILYMLINFLELDAYSGQPVTLDYIYLGFWLNVPVVITFSYLIANLMYEIKRPVHAYKVPENQKNGPWPSVSFLISAYNEEKLIGRCIESIDRAAAKYAGKVDIVIVNDGSRDNTERIISESLRKLKFCSGVFYTIPNSGKGFALAYGLQRTSGDIIFRTDADSALDENALTPMLSHFKNPEVGSVSCWIMPLEGNNGAWLKAQNILCAYYFYTKRAQEMVDGIITQPGPASAYRRDILIKAGGWVDNIFGEDGEITNRVARLGYRGVFEGNALIYSELPETLVGFMQQRARWSVAFFHSRGRNLRLTREVGNSRWPVFLWNLMSHGISLGRGLLWPYMAVSIIMGTLSLPTPELISYGVVIAKLLGIQAMIYAISLILYAYRLKKAGRTGDIVYFPLVRFLVIILNWIVKPQALEVLLSWSVRWKTYTTESFRDLRKVVHTSIDPLYPSGEQVAHSKKTDDTAAAAS
jgi:cellulose synthase/poly-beta-1,6-N-acetylglucosamine synthase-like glycosyltransferase